ncbi:MAG TPA: hypothetical protein VE955_03595, partial [Candidatus Dormibacteraeota bacterium]|nr:hypothetical protein [Candidatus Dormibacteraeota bacterium]
MIDSCLYKLVHIRDKPLRELHSYKLQSITPNRFSRPLKRKKGLMISEPPIMYLSRKRIRGFDDYGRRKEAKHGADGKDTGSD